MYNKYRSLLVQIPFESLVGKTLTKVKNDDNEIRFETTDGEKFVMYHDNDCCESVTIDEIHGDLSDLIESPILNAEERISFEDPPKYTPESYTWTFYGLATVKGSVTIRWYGESNGYYSERVSFAKETT